MDGLAHQLERINMSGPIVCFVCFSVVGFCIFMLYRTWDVWCFASSLADRVCELTQQDLAAGHGTTFWRWKALQSVSFDEMANRLKRLSVADTHGLSGPFAPPACSSR